MFHIFGSVSRFQLSRGLLRRATVRREIQRYKRVAMASAAMACRRENKECPMLIAFDLGEKLYRSRTQSWMLEDKHLSVGTRDLTPDRSGSFQVARQWAGAAKAVGKAHWKSSSKTDFISVKIARALCRVLASLA